MAGSRNNHEKAKLIDALSNDDLETFATLVEGNPSLLITPLRGSKKETLPLYVAFANRRLDIVNFILEKHPDLSQEIIPLFDWAIDQRDRNQCVEILIEAGALRFVKNPRMHPIFEAARRMHSSLVKLYLNHDAGLLNQTTTNNRSLAMIAAASGDYQTLRYLVELGADLHIESLFSKDDDDAKCNTFTAYDWAMKYGNYDCLILLIHAGILKSKSSEDIHKLLHLGIYKYEPNLIISILNFKPSLVDTYISGLVLLAHAAKTGQVTTLSYLIDDYKADIHSHGEIALVWATKEGHYDCVDTLIKAGVPINFHSLLTIAIAAGHLDLVEFYVKKDTSLTGDSDQITVFLEQAICLRQWDIAVFLFLRSPRSLNLIQDSEFALAIIKQNPDLWLTLSKDKKTHELLYTSTHQQAVRQHEGKTTFYTRARGRSNSTYTIIDETTHHLSIFQPKEELGSGCDGIVRLFISNKGEKRAIKEPIQDSPGEDFHEVKKEKAWAENEITLLKMIDPVKKEYDSFHFDSTKKRPQPFYTNRLVMPFFGRETLHSVIAMMTSPCEYADITLALALELQKIHDCGVIHGDLKSSNVIIDRHRCIYYIDCSRSYKKTDQTATIFLFQKDSSHLPPERFYHGDPSVSPPDLPPHTNQDIFSFGHLLKAIFTDEEYQALVEACPCIGHFVNQAISIDPASRPELNAFCETLNKEMATLRQKSKLVMGK